jgi:predicted nucleic acid-binding protein
LIRRVFADTSYWIALLNPRDELHRKALDVSERNPLDEIVTSEMVLAELLNSFGDRGPRLRQAAAKAVEALRSNRMVVIRSQTHEQFEAALLRYHEMADKSWSMTDCASFLIMEEEGIRAALTHDKHFMQAGFEALLR